jgi:hypothetical protein
VTELGASDLLRGLVREVIADLVAESVGTSGRVAGLSGAEPAAARVEDVAIAGDGDLQAFALRLLGMFEDPVARQDLRAGRIRFRLANGAAAPPTPSAGQAHRIDRGAVTERMVRAAAGAGADLVLGPKAVLTPLARDQARRLGVRIVKERS